MNKFLLTSSIHILMMLCFFANPGESAANLTGDWELTIQGVSRSSYYADVFLKSNGTFTYVEYIDGYYDWSGSGAWTYNSSTKYLHSTADGARAVGTISGTEVNFYISGSYEGHDVTYHFVKQGNDEVIWYRDYDNDGYGSQNNSTSSASQPSGYVSSSSDCNDYDRTIHPGATEIRGDGIDQDCNGSDLESLITYYHDGDNDGYGDPNTSYESPSQPTGYVLNNKDCNDNDSNIHPGVTENQNYTDDNCDGFVDNIIPDKVNLTSPSSATEETTPTFTWNEDPYSTWYRLLVWNSSEKKVHGQWYDASDICSGGSCTVTPESEWLSDNYEWWVKSWNDYGHVWSDGMTFTVQGDNTPPSKITHTSPSGQLASSASTFTWVADPASTWYRLWVGYPGDQKIFAQWYEAANICSDGTCSVTTGTEFNVGNYEWYIKSWNDYGKIWSDGMYFSYFINNSSQETIANYPLTENGEDITGNFLEMIIENCPFQENGVYSTGVYYYHASPEPGEPADGCLIQTPLLSELDKNNFEISVDFKISKLPITSMPVFVLGNGYREMAFYIETDQTVSLRLDNGVKIYRSSQSYKVNAWQKGTITYSSNTVQLYIDDVLAIEKSFIISMPDDDKIITNTNFSNGDCYKGLLKNLIIRSN